MKKRMPDSPRGFTLVELLIVIVIIGVLAGILIAVVNPQKQINHARDATLRANLNKIALALKAHISAYRQVPDGTFFTNSLQSVTIIGPVVSGLGGNCGDVSDACNFTVTASPLPATCVDTAPYTGDGTGAGFTQCTYRWTAPSGLTNTEFRVVAKSWGSSNVFVYHSQSEIGSSFERTYLCPPAYNDSYVLPGGCVLTF